MTRYQDTVHAQAAPPASLNLSQPRVLVLNASYEPLHVCSIKRAITLVMYEVAEVLENSADFIRSPSTAMPVPSVIRLKRYIRRPRIHPIPFSRRNVMRRDFYTCQYCGSKHELTLDHVIPRSKGGRHTWENVVTACRDCNQKKGDRMPDLAGMPLTVKPRVPSFGVYAYGHVADVQPNWEKYIG